MRRIKKDVDRAILDATWAELMDRGYSGVTFEGVAKAAATSKPVVYRRYHNRAALVFAALRLHQGLPQPLTSTGALRDDLIAWLEAASSRASQIGADNYRALLGEADAGLLADIQAFIGAVGSDLEEQVIQPARERGELGADPIEAMMLTLPMTLMRDGVLFRAPGIQDAEEVVDLICLPLFKVSSGLPAHKRSRI